VTQYRAQAPNFLAISGEAPLKTSDLSPTNKIEETR
jgi:hypothetical protein